MDIHKPQAAHSWREFLTEIGTIIFGILIALGIELTEAIREEILRQAREKFGACAHDPMARSPTNFAKIFDDRRQFDAGGSARAILGLRPLK